MLIKVPEHNNLQGVAKDKNPYWESRGITPNEAKELDPRYDRALRKFTAHNKLKGPHRFFEVRIVRNRPVVDALHQNWWEHPAFMDKVYWMFQRPYTILLEHTYKPYLLYVLEPMECWRVQDVMYRLTGKLPQGDRRTAHIVPVDCCELAWTETKAGISEHIHYRPKLEPDQEHIDQEAKKKAEIDKLLSRSMDISEVLPSKES